MMKNWKTYAVCAATVSYALVEWLIVGTMSQDVAMAMIFGGAGLGALRHAVGPNQS